jgi:DNA-binding NtrC family response regulator
MVACFGDTVHKSGHKAMCRSSLGIMLGVFPIRVPPLRDRREDILPLALDFARHYGNA